jgi:hypothetical protein
MTDHASHQVEVPRLFYEKAHADAYLDTERSACDWVVKVMITPVFRTASDPIPPARVSVDISVAPFFYKFFPLALLGGLMICILGPFSILPGFGRIVSRWINRYCDWLEATGL